MITDSENINRLEEDNYRCEANIQVLQEKIKQNQDLIEFYEKRIQINDKLILNEKINIENLSKNGSY